MNLFQALLSRTSPRRRPAPARPTNSDALPPINACINVASGGRLQSLPVESIEGEQFEIRRPEHVVVGTTVLFDYSNARGRFRFHAKCVALSDRTAFFEVPPHIMEVERSDRRIFRIDCVIPILWRYAPGGEGYGTLTRSATANISAGGVAFIVPRALRAGTQVEIHLALNEAPTLVLIASLARPSEQQHAGKHLACVAFNHLLPAEATVIEEFIATCERRRRDRGMANT
jgi:c-di-GMP-binding flagellar brake protein YcgR